MYCSNCGSKIPEGALECPECKEKIVSDSETPVEEIKEEITVENSIEKSIVEDNKETESNVEKPVQEESETKEEPVVVDNTITEEKAEETNNVESVNKPNTEINNETISLHDTKDTGGPGSALLGFFLPPVGLIMYIINRKKKPNNSKANLRGAIFGTITFTVAYLTFTYVIKPLLMPIANQSNCEVRCGSDEKARYEKDSGYCRCSDGRVFQIEYK